MDKKKMQRRYASIPHYAQGGGVGDLAGLAGGVLGMASGVGIPLALGGLFSDAGKASTVQNDFKADLADTQTSNYGGTIDQAGANALGGHADYQSNLARQGQLADRLQSIANGQGPNPAQAMLNQATGQNVANQAALAAGQRGSSQNVGMMARQAMMAGAGAQQQAAGQGATLQAQQSLNALGQQGQVLGQMGNLGVSQQNANTGLFSAAAGAQNTQNANAITNTNNMNTLNQKTAQSNADSGTKAKGGLMDSLGGVTSMLGGLFSKGGMVPDHIRDIHSIYHADAPPPAAAPAMSIKEKTNQFMHDQFADVLSDDAYKKSLNLKDPQPQKSAISNFANGGMSGDISPNFFGVQRHIADWATEGKSARQMSADQYNIDPRNRAQEQGLPGDMKGSVAVRDFRSGGQVPGQAAVAGDSLQNDNQPAMLSPKEIVLPRSVTMSEDAPERAKAFVAAILKEQGHGNSNHYKEFHKALKSAILSRKKKSGA